MAGSRSRRLPSNDRRVGFCHRLTHDGPCKPLGDKSSGAGSHAVRGSRFGENSLNCARQVRRRGWYDEAGIVRSHVSKTHPFGEHEWNTGGKGLIHGCRVRLMS
jgi:hypothetical protein